MAISHRWTPTTFLRLKYAGITVDTSLLVSVRNIDGEPYFDRVWLCLPTLGLEVFVDIGKSWVFARRIERLRAQSQPALVRWANAYIRENIKRQGLICWLSHQDGDPFLACITRSNLLSVFCTRGRTAARRKEAASGPTKNAAA